LTVATHERLLLFLVARGSVATAFLTRDGATIVPFDRGSHHAAVLPWADGDAAWADADSDV
jgi:Ser/Thr protein kinase RdoA (MazF antagonist)